MNGLVGKKKNFEADTLMDLEPVKGPNDRGNVFRFLSAGNQSSSSVLYSLQRSYVRVGKTSKQTITVIQM